MEIGVWGDSITYGTCDTEALGWVGRLRKSFSPEEYIEVYNFGVSGHTSKDILKRFLVEAEALNPQIIIIAVGINDSKYSNGESHQNVPLIEFQRNIREIILQARKFTKDIYIVGLTQVDESITRSSESRFSNASIVLYDRCLKDVATNIGLPFIGQLETLDVKSDLYDGLHPNSNGYEKMYEVVKSRITEHDKLVPKT